MKAPFCFIYHLALYKRGDFSMMSLNTFQPSVNLMFHFFLSLCLVRISQTPCCVLARCLCRWSAPCPKRSSLRYYSSLLRLFDTWNTMELQPILFNFATGQTIHSGSACAHTIRPCSRVRSWKILTVHLKHNIHALVDRRIQILVETDPNIVAKVWLCGVNIWH